MSRFDPSELQKYGGLALIARQIVEGFLSGVHRSPFKGFSVEFAEHRPYYPGDEIRHIDWRTFGKTDRFFIKEYQDETNLKTYLLVDASGSMSYRGEIATQSKYQLAQKIAAALSYLLLQQRDTVGLITHAAKLRQHLPPRTIPKQLLFLLKTLEQTDPQGDTNLASIWHEVAEHHLPSRGLVILLSDCLAPLESLIRALYHFRHRKHEVILFHILAPEELEFPFSSMTQFRHLEQQSEHVLLDPKRFRSEYQDNVQTFCRGLREATARMQIDYQLIRTDETVDRALGTYLSRRFR